MDVYLDSNNLIHIKFTGEINELQHMVVAETMDTLKQQLATEGKPVLYLVDISGLQKVNELARKNIFSKMDDKSDYKVAVFGASKFFKFLIELLTNLVNTRDKYRLFENEADATAWLLGTK